MTADEALEWQKYDEDAKVVWDFLAVSAEPQTSMGIFVFGGVSKSVPPMAAKLFKDGISDTILVTGGSGARTHLHFKRAEALEIRDALIDLGVPESAILTEESATNSGENVEFGMREFLSHRPFPSSLALVSAPFIMRRCLATFAKQFPMIHVIPCPPAGGAREHIDRSRAEFATRLVAEVDRLDEYSRQGYISDVLIPDSVRAACKKIVSLAAA